jgi:hypothetical protein
MRMLDQLHDHDLALDPKKHLVGLLKETKTSVKKAHATVYRDRLTLAVASLTLIRLLKSACFGTILTAANWPVCRCLTILTLPLLPLPIVFPMRHGPTCFGSRLPSSFPLARSLALSRSTRVCTFRLGLGGEPADMVSTVAIVVNKDVFCLELSLFAVQVQVEVEVGDSSKQVNNR